MPVPGLEVVYIDSTVQEWMDTRLHTHTHAHTHARTHVRTHAPTHTHTHTHTHEGKCVLHTHSEVSKSLDTHTLHTTHTHTHNTHTHTHTSVYVRQMKSYQIDNANMFINQECHPIIDHGPFPLWFLMTHPPLWSKPPVRVTDVHQSLGSVIDIYRVLDRVMYVRVHACVCTQLFTQTANLYYMIISAFSKKITSILFSMCCDSSVQARRKERIGAEGQVRKDPGVGRFLGYFGCPS